MLHAQSLECGDESDCQPGSWSLGSNEEMQTEDLFTCSVGHQPISLAQVLASFPRLKQLQLDKHAASLLLRPCIPGWLYHSLEGCSSIRLAVSGLAAPSSHEPGVQAILGTMGALETPTDAVTGEHTVRAPLQGPSEPARKLVQELFQPGRLAAISFSIMGELPPLGLHPSAHVHLQQFLAPYLTPDDPTTMQPAATTLTELRALGHSVTAGLLEAAGKLPQLQVVSLSVEASSWQHLTALHALPLLSNLCLEMTAPANALDPWNHMLSFLQGCPRLGRLGVISALMPRSFATIASRAAEEVYLCTDSYASPHFATQEPWRGPFLPGDMCARLELPWPPDLFESVSDMREGLPMSRTVQLQHLAFPMAPSTAFQVVPWDSRCVRTLRSLRLDVRPVGGLQDCWSQGVGGLTGLTKLVIIGAKPIEMYGRYHMKVMGAGSLKPITNLISLCELTIDILEPFGEGDLVYLQSLTALTSLFLGDLSRISDLSLGLLMPLRALRKVHLRHMNPGPHHNERPVLSVEALAHFAAGHPFACRLCLGEVATCSWHQTALSRRFSPDVGLLLEFEGLTALAALCPDGKEACEEHLKMAMTALQSIGQSTCMPPKFKEYCTSGKALAAFQLLRSRRWYS